MSLCQNQSTWLNTYYELGYFELIRGENINTKVKNLLIVLKQINQFWHKPLHTNTNLQKMYCIHMVCTNHASHC